MREMRERRERIGQEKRVPVEYDDRVSCSEVQPKPACIM